MRLLLDQTLVAFTRAVDGQRFPGCDGTRHSALSFRGTAPGRKLVVPQASRDSDSAVREKPSRGAGLGDLLGPIGLSLGKSKDTEVLTSS